MTEVRRVIDRTLGFGVGVILAPRVTDRPCGKRVRRLPSWWPIGVCACAGPAVVVMDSDGRWPRVARLVAAHGPTWTSCAGRAWRISPTCRVWAWR
jgi:riboflavin biosynthesis pyrimidine reductase